LQKYASEHITLAVAIGQFNIHANLRTDRGGNSMQEHPLKTLETLDPKLLSLVEDMRQLAFHDGALPKKFKFLIALALQTALLADNGIKSFAQLAMQAGATKEEIAEVLRVVGYINGAASTYTASWALKDLF
jgi:alkylhydroperoxidase/carboxymuconolactone decarboxylase family protein YurZ